MRLGLVAVVVVFLGSSVSSAAQPPQPGAPAPGSPGSQGQVTPPRAGIPGDAPVTGAGILRGWVVAADTGEPVRRALVRAAAPGGGGVTSTDEDGRFEIRDLPAGRYTLMASKGGYVAIQYGQRQPRQAGTPFELCRTEVLAGSEVRPLHAFSRI